MINTQNVHVWHLTMIEFDDSVWVEGTVIKGPKKLLQEPNTWFGHFINTFRLYFEHPAKDIQLHINTGAEQKKVNTTEKGHFSCLLKSFNSKDFNISYQGHVLEVVNTYPHYFDNSNSKIEVISDLDDTVLYSHTASVLKRMYNILFVLPNKRKSVDYTQEILEWLNNEKSRIIYLSKSESNLFRLISTFLKFKGLPKGPLLLSPYLRYFQLLKPNKGKDYKYNHLKTLIVEQPRKQFVLLGDDTQRDMEIYTKIIHDFPKRILKVFIRQTGFTRNETQEALWQDLKTSGVEAVYFRDEESAKREIENFKTLHTL